MQNNKIIIIGAGLGGLTFAQGLKKAGLPFHIYERDPTSDFRAQGYRIRITPEGGQALQDNLSPELFDLFERTAAETILGRNLFNALDGTSVQGGPGRGGPGGQGGPGGPGPQGGPGGPGGPGANENVRVWAADRTTLRSLLLLGLQENMTFGKEFDRYEETATGVTVYFKDGSSDEGALLVGADGLRSRVRKQYLPENVIVDTDGRIIYGKTIITEELLEKFPKNAMKGMSILMDKRHEVPLILLYEPIRFVKDVGTESDGKLPSVKDYIYWVLLSRKATIGIEDEDLWKLSREEIKEKSLKLTQDWDSAFRSVLELQDVSQTSALRISSALPDLPVWTPSARVTLIGDAIHVMSPTGGVGANTALRDAYHLCQALIEGGITAESIGKYEVKMREYAKKAIEDSLQGGKKLYSQPDFKDCKPLDL